MLIRPYKEDDFDAIYEIINKKFKQAEQENSQLPSPSFLTYERLKRNIPSDTLVAEKYNSVIGFLGGFFLEDIDSHPKGFLTPLSLHGVHHNEKKTIVYYELVKKMSDYAITHTVHNLAILIHSFDTETKEIFFNLGYGGLTVDFIRGLELIDVKANDSLKIELATISDLEHLYPLFKGIQDHLMSSPTYLFDNDPYSPILSFYERQLNEGHNFIYKAVLNKKIIGYIKFTTKHINRQELDGGTTIGINGFFIDPKYRGSLIGSHLLNAVIIYAKQNQFTHIMTDCETANFEALHFWSKHFKPYSIGLLRHINELVKR